MSRADTITFSNFLLDTLGDTTQLGSFYDELVQEVGRGVFPGVVSLTGAALVAVVAGTATVTFPSTAIRPLIVAFDNTVLSETTDQDAAVYDLHWRVTRGRPFAYSMSDEDQRVVALVPVPAVDGETIGGSTVFVFTAWPSENLMFIYTETRTDVHLDEELWFACEMVARELARDSNHHDQMGASAARKIADLFRTLSHVRS